MTDSSASLVAILFGLGVFAVIVAVGWRSVQNRRIVRMQGADGHETIIVAGEDDEITSIATTTDAAPAGAAPDPSASEGHTDAPHPAPAPEFGRKVT